MEEKELENLKQEIKEIQKRNQRVEADKAWETSMTRKISICVLTYIVVVLFSVFINKTGNVFINSAVPVIGFFLSTQSLEFIKKRWILNKEKEER
ncbi:MAG: hypothetical protein ACLS95_04385 [Clostridia bacterium]